MDMFSELTCIPGLDLEWQMTICERFALASLLERNSPELSLEIGTYRGGSLQLLSHFSKRVVSLDIDPTVATTLKGKFENVEFFSGDSKTLLPDIIEKLNSHNDPLEFVIIDGDHSSEGVRRDINAVLKLRPKKRVLIIMHDSFNPQCRQGMLSADWSNCPYVQKVELDFIPGLYHEFAYDTASAKTMWGGFACAILEPHERKDNLIVKERQKGLFDVVFSSSSHATNAYRKRSLYRRLTARIARMFETTI